MRLDLSSQRWKRNFPFLWERYIILDKVSRKNSRQLWRKWIKYFANVTCPFSDWIAQLTTLLAFVPSTAVNTNAWSMPEMEVVGSCAMAARNALIIGPTVYGGIVAPQGKTGTPTTTTGTVTTITQNGRPDKSPPAFWPSWTLLVKEFHSSARQSSLARTRVPSRPAL